MTWQTAALLGWLTAVLAGCSAFTSSPPAAPGADNGVTSGAPDRAPQSAMQPVWQDAFPRPDPILPQGNSSPYEVNGATYLVMDSARGYSEEGIASWYGMKFHGRPTANGEIFDVYAPTAAHRSLPIPSYVRVTNRRNNRTVILRVNDRGPFHPDRLIDLSYGAAKALGFAEQGTAPVWVEALHLAGVDDRRALDASAYRFLQLGAYESADTAQHIASDVKALLMHPATVSPVDIAGQRLHRVRAGPFPDAPSLARAEAQLLEAGYESPQRVP